MLFNTERGMISVDALAFTKKQAEADGYSYAFHSDELNLDVYGKSLDPQGHEHSFKLLVDRNITEKELFEKLVEFDKFEDKYEDLPYQYYKSFGSDQEFVLEDKDIPTFNELVEELNEDCKWLWKFKEDHKGTSLIDDPLYKEHFAHHADVYERYMNILDSTGMYDDPTDENDTIQY